MSISQRVFSITGIVLLLAASSAEASTFSPLNARPGVAVNASVPAGEQSLQSILDYMLGGSVSATQDQSGAAEWGVGLLPASVLPTLAFEYSPSAANGILGVWSGSTASELAMVDLFDASAVGLNTSPDGFVSGAKLAWNTAGTLMKVQGDCGSGVNCGTFSGINPFAFGFYLKVPNIAGGSTTYFTADALNGDGKAHALTYRDGATRDWAIAFDEGSDHDFNDAVLKVESLEAVVPEPGTLILFGTGLLGCARAARRRRQQA